VRFVNVDYSGPEGEYQTTSLILMLTMRKRRSRCVKRNLEKVDVSSAVSGARRFARRVNDESIAGLRRSSGLNKPNDEIPS
jgi:hypothetical protein